MFSLGCFWGGAAPPYCANKYTPLSVYSLTYLLCMKDNTYIRTSTSHYTVSIIQIPSLIPLYQTLTMWHTQLYVGNHQGFPTHPLRNAVVMHSWQNRCTQSLVVMVLRKTSRQMGHVSSAPRQCLLKEAAVLSVISSCGLRWSSYGERSTAQATEHTHAPVVSTTHTDSHTCTHTHTHKLLHNGSVARQIHMLQNSC